jgi:hypothetical protein
VPPAVVRSPLRPWRPPAMSPAAPPDNGITGTNNEDRQGPSSLFIIVDSGPLYSLRPPASAGHRQSPPGAVRLLSSLGADVGPQDGVDLALVGVTTPG